jgi:hypothetical protein
VKCTKARIPIKNPAIPRRIYQIIGDFNLSG